MVALPSQKPVSDRIRGSAVAIASHSQQRRGSNWIHEALAVIETQTRGYGVVALEQVSAGTLVIMYGGNVITSAEFDQLSYEMQNFPFQVAEDLFLAPRDDNDLGIGERINHSCAPTVGFSGPIGLVALRDIKQGEEVTLEYATCVASDDGAFVMECQCGAADCRKVITGQDWKLPELQKRLFPHFQPFLQERIRTQQGGEGAAKLIRLSSIRNADVIERRSFSVGSVFKSILSLPKRVINFGKEALRREWMAIPICIIAGFPSTLATTGIMALISPSLRNFEFAQSEAAFISAISLISSVIGYATYLFAYYVGMLWKERKDWVTNGRIHRDGLRRKMKIIKYDFVAHLPSDFWVMPLMGAATGSFFVVGLSQFWSIVLAHTLADIAYAIKEPFFWHGAKEIVAWQEQRRIPVVTVSGKTDL